ncbi:UPF0454 protein C12orf49 homolog [Exaiptasia diaphana]|uniref:SREBP regulating gene protein n=1 Tax=Exaiptasia diaphana TaxID=2652724 RepID=A0A913Y4X8_EXADI|nr:UPF0454 protein C12orf49 homolog [Exaiptasia diaphana]KXJ29046.1 UPF0454 protein C12orf49-like [Exaiptasia diaphana]
MSVFFIRRWIIAFAVALGVILIISLSFRKSADDQDLGESTLKSFTWIDIENLTEYRQCRNSVQGASLIVDDRGFVCQRKDLSASGCCHSHGESTKRFFCESCLINNCCGIYEDCVSCCLDPKKKTLLLEGLNLWRSGTNVIFKTVKDQFELCLTKCRTSSKSVWHENSYKDRKFKHCFGITSPEFSP